MALTASGSHVATSFRISSGDRGFSRRLGFFRGAIKPCGGGGGGEPPKFVGTGRPSDSAQCGLGKNYMVCHRKPQLQIQWAVLQKPIENSQDQILGNLVAERRESIAQQNSVVVISSGGPSGQYFIEIRVHHPFSKS